MRRFDVVIGAPADTIIPQRGTMHSAGYDFYLPCDVVIKPYGQSKLIPLNIKAYMHPNEFLSLQIRSSLAIKRKLSIQQGRAIIDADYAGNPKNDGNIGIMLQNNSGRWQRLKKGEKVCQGIFERYYTVDDDKATGKRTGGYGSTGK